jgi:hypothetical protein
LLLLKADESAQKEVAKKPGQWEWIKGLVEEDFPLLSVALAMGMVWLSLAWRLPSSLSNY